MVKREVVAFVERILSAKLSNPNADISEFEQQIDTIVYKLFDLSPEEIDLIEQA